MPLYPIANRSTVTDWTTAAEPGCSLTSSLKSPFFSACSLKNPYVPDAELRPYMLIGLLAHSPVNPSWPHVLMSSLPPVRRDFEKIASTWVRVSDLIGLSLLTNTAKASTDVRTS